MTGCKLRLSNSILFLLVSVFLCPAATAQENTGNGELLPEVFKNLQEVCISYLRPGQVKERLEQVPVVYVPVGPIEWHGLHMPFGADPLNAQTVALAVCKITGGIVWPTLSFGSASLRNPEQSKKLFGFEEGLHTWSVDFPGNILPSAYCSAEILALIVRETIREASNMGAKLIVLMSGHAAGPHLNALESVAREVTAEGKVLVYTRGAWEKEPLYPKKDGHATAGETSLIMAQTNSVDLSKLPPLPEKLKYTETGIVDDWSSSGKTNYMVLDEADPRRAASPAYGKAAIAHTVEEITEEVRGLLNKL
ncbi:creatininase family protein [Gemmatimonadota bacterium]